MSARQRFGRTTTGRSMGLAIALAVLVAWAPFRALAAVEVQRVVSPGGIEAWLVEDRSNPIIAMRFAFRGGAALDPQGKAGLANMVSGLLDEGAGDLDSQAFQEQLETLSVQLSFDAGRDSFGGRLKTITGNLDTATDLLRLAVTRPRFDSEPVERIRSQIAAGLRRDAERPGAIASREFFAALFPDHPYALPVRGTLDSVAAIDAEDLRRFVSQRLTRDGLLIGVVGDISAENLAPLLDTIFGDLPQSGADGHVDDLMSETNGTTRVVELSVPQSAVIFGQRGIARDHPDYYAATVMNHILGGGSFTSRLYQEVREKRGLVYSVYSSLVPLDHGPLIIGRAGTANARVAETLDVVRGEWQRLAENGVTAEELEASKQFLTGSFPLRFTSSDRIANVLVAMQLYDLGIDYLDRRNALIEAVTLADVNRVAASLLDPESLTVMVVGQPEGLGPTN